MKRYFLTLVLLALTSCNPGANNDSTTGDSGSTTATPANGGCPALEINKDVCEQAKDSSGAILGCKINKFTEKCVPANRENVVRVGECPEVKGTECYRPAVVQIADESLKVVGLCRVNRVKLTECEEAPKASGKQVEGQPGAKKCVATTDNKVLREAAEEICKNYQSGGTKILGRTMLTKPCSDIDVPSGNRLERIRLCGKVGHTDKCGGYRTDDVPALGGYGTDPIKKYCASLIKREDVANADFTALITEQDVKDCGMKPLYTEADDKGQIRVSGTNAGICNLEDN